MESVLGQTFTDYEIIIVNDGSTDKSGEVAAKFKNPNIHIYTQKNHGVSAARNFALEKATGEVMAFLDADDLWLPNHLEDLYKLYRLFPDCSLYATSYEMVFSPSKTVQPVFDGIPGTGWYGIIPDFFKSSMEYRLAWTSAVAVIRKKLPEPAFEVGINMAEDTELWIKMALAGPVAFCNTVSARQMLQAENRISDRKVLSRKYARLTAFAEEEKNNISLKKYMDLYRTEFGLRHKTAGDLKTSGFYLKEVNRHHLSRKTRFLLSLPVWMLRILYALKKALERKGFLLSAYH